MIPPSNAPLTISLLVYNNTITFYTHKHKHMYAHTLSHIHIRTQPPSKHTTTLTAHNTPTHAHTPPQPPTRPPRHSPQTHPHTHPHTHTHTHNGYAWLEVSLPPQQHPGTCAADLSRHQQQLVQSAGALQHPLISL